MFDIPNNPKANTYLNSETGQNLTAKQWAKLIGISDRNFRSRHRQWGDNPKTFAIKYNPKIYTHPVTGQSLTARQWDIELGLCDGRFRERISCHGDCEAAYLPPQRRGAKPRRFFRNPETGEAKTASQWGETLNISESGFRRRVQTWGSKDPRTYSKGSLLNDGIHIIHRDTKHVYRSLTAAGKALNYSPSGIRNKMIRNGLFKRLKASMPPHTQTPQTQACQGRVPYRNDL
jgi:hypothetical protein